MQTFLPYSDFKKSLDCLDYKRLGKQRVEAFQLLKCFYIKDYSWRSHPAFKMWKRYENALWLYHNTAISLWKDRGYKNTMALHNISGEIVMPEWLGNDRFHSSHRSNLLRKDFRFYSQYNWSESTNIPYYWNGYGNREGENNEISEKSQR